MAELIDFSSAKVSFSSKITQIYQIINLLNLRNFDMIFADFDLTSLRVIPAKAGIHFVHQSGFLPSRE